MYFLSYIVFIFEVYSLLGIDVDDFPDNMPMKNRVEVRAVFIKCEPDDSSESDTTRFERQELFKHNALRQCNKKLAVTMKLASDADVNTGDEYIPIGHVFEDSKNKRVRLLNPYIFRLKRELTLQAYKIRRIDTVSGVLTKDTVHNLKKRDRSESEAASPPEPGDWSRALELTGPVFTLEHNEPGRHSYSVRIDDVPEVVRDTTTDNKQASKDCGLRLFSEPENSKPLAAPIHLGSRALQQHPLIKVFERHEVNTGLQNLRKHNAVKKDTCAETINTATRKKRYQQNFIKDDDRSMKHISVSSDLGLSDGNSDYNTPDQKEHFISEKNRKSLEEYANSAFRDIPPTEKDLNLNSENFNRKFIDTPITEKTVLHHEINAPSNRKTYDVSSEKHFTLYEIGDPNLWYKVNVQLFEKMSTPEGRTVWNDLTRGVQASVGTIEPEWKNQDMSLRYRPSEWTARDEFTLPTRGLCLLTPLNENDDANFTDVDSNKDGYLDNGQYIVVPIEDVVALEENINNLSKRNGNYSDSSTKSFVDGNEKSYRKVEVRVARALFGGEDDNFRITLNGADRYLTLPHNRPHHAQIDLEVRADDNQLVRVGLSGSITTVVSDSTRKTRSIITIQASNTGLVSSMFRVRARDCGPELSGIINENNIEGTTTNPMMLPPRHTRGLHLELPIEMPVDTAHCSVALINEDDETVAVRDVAIRKADRCFCVWHCECVCLGEIKKIGEDPKLLCREMSQSSQIAAGLPSRQHGRHVRSACYSNNPTVNLFVIIVGVFIMLLLLGLSKALLGLKCSCIAFFEIGRILQMPRKLPEYYEGNLKGQTVVYNDEGWPINPDTKKRVMPVSRSMLFLLNTLFFLIYPFVVIRDSICKIFSECISCATKVKSATSQKEDTKKCFSTHDMQSTELQLRRRRRPGLRRWMSPHAEELSGDLWQRELIPQGVATAETMRPLLQTEHLCRSKELQHANGDSEQDDTDYVLMQMQKSRESLSRSQVKPKDSSPSSNPYPWPGDEYVSRK